jgi:hypothetical protein
MRDNQKEPTFEFGNWFDGGNIFYRSKDKQRFQFALDAIVDEGLGLAVIGTNEAVLDHYCRMLVARLRDLNIFQLEVFLPTNTDSLLKRFNEMLATMSLEMARKPADLNAPVKLLVVNDAKSVNEEQWNLLVRLIADFPGVNVRLVLFLDTTGWPGYEKPLGMFGRRLYRWVVETPSLEEASELMQAAKENGYQGETETLLLHAGLGEAIRGGYSEDPSLPNQDENDYLGEDYSDNNPFPDLGVDFLEEQDQRYDDVVDDDLMKTRKKWPVIAIFSISLLLTFLLISRFNPEATEEYEQRLSGALTEIADTSKNAQLSESITLPAEEAEPVDLGITEDRATQVLEARALVAAIKLERKKPTTEKVSAVNNPEVKKPLVEKPPINKPQIESPKPRQVVKRAIPLKASAVVAPKSAVRPVADVAPGSVLAIVDGAKSTDFFVQHIVLSSKAQAAPYIKLYPGLNQAFVLPITAGSAVSYAVVSGPFTSRLTATNFTKAYGLPADYWIRASPALGAAAKRN